MSEVPSGQEGERCLSSGGEKPEESSFLPGEPTGRAPEPELPAARARSPPCASFFPCRLSSVPSVVLRVSLEDAFGKLQLEGGAGGGAWAPGLRSPPSSAPPPALAVQPPAADSIPVQDVSILQQSPRLPRLPRPALPGGGGEPCPQGRDQVLLLQEGAHPAGPGRRQLGEPPGSPLQCPGLSWNPPESGPALQRWKELGLSGPWLRIGTQPV